MSSTDWTASERDRREFVVQGLAVVANQKFDRHLIAWAREAGLCVRIDRLSRWGNPFRIPADGSRDDVCDRFAHHLAKRPALLEQIADLRGKVLVCWCHPLRCHGHHLAALANQSNHARCETRAFDDEARRERPV